MSTNDTAPGATNLKSAAGGAVPPTSILLKHSHSVPVKSRKVEMNPLLFRNSRSNIYDSADGEDGDEQRQCVDTSDILISSCSPDDAGTGTGTGAGTGADVGSDVKKVKRMSIKKLLNSSYLHLNNSQTWTVDNNKVEEISPLFQTQLQRTHTIIDENENDNNEEDACSPSTVATNISNYLKSISASTLYDDENAIAHAELEDDLRILIRLFWKTEVISNKDKDPTKRKRQILVEVSRRNGCSAQYHSTAMNILSAARGSGAGASGDGDHIAIANKEFGSESSSSAKGGTAASSIRRSSLRSKAREAKVPAELRNEFLKQVKII